MEKMHKMLEKAVVSAVIAGMLGLGIIAFLLGVVGIGIASVNRVTLVGGYILFCLAIWLVLMFPYIKKV